MKVLIACEYSGVVRDAFIARGHDAESVDLLPTERPGPHTIGDALAVLKRGKWDLLIAHPPCTRLTNSGVRWLHERNLWAQLDEACAFFRALLAADVERVAIENPIPHKYALERIGQKYSQIIHPWQHGHGESKATCLWLKNLPPIEPTNIVEGREQKCWKMGPSEDRAKRRAETLPGIATAFASQWG